MCEQQFEKKGVNVQGCSVMYTTETGETNFDESLKEKIEDNLPDDVTSKTEGWLNDENILQIQEYKFLWLELSPNVRFFLWGLRPHFSSVVIQVNKYLL